MNLVILGNVCIDKNTIGKTSYKAAGGPVTFISMFFKDVKGVLLTSIASYGADFLPFKNSLNLYPLNPNALNTLVYENTIDYGKRTQKCHFYKKSIPPQINKNMKNIIKNADVLFITPLIPHFSTEYIKNVIELTNKNCLKILLPQGYFRQFDENDNVVFRKFEEVDALLPLVDFSILSSEDYPDIENLSLEWSKKHNTNFIITGAEKGATIINKNGKALISTNPIPFDKIVDSIGAGEFFTASFTYNYLKNKDVEKSVELANKATGEKLLAKTKDLQKDLG